MTDDFTGKRVLVTGAAKGIGLATAKLLAERGAEVIAFDRSVVDLADVEATRAAVRAVLPVDMLVNCAGIVELESFLDTSAETFDRTMAVNTRAPLVVAQEVARDLVRRGSPGAIVNVSSLAAAVGTRDHTAYCASKAALDAITRVMALELGPHRIRGQQRQSGRDADARWRRKPGAIRRNQGRCWGAFRWGGSSSRPRWRRRSRFC